MNKPKLTKAEKSILELALSYMEELKDDPNRERFCVNFDEEYKKTKERLERGYW